MLVALQASSPGSARTASFVRRRMEPRCGSRGRRSTETWRSTVASRKGSETSNRSTAKRHLPIASPTLPDLEVLLPRLREIWASGEITNGRTVAELERAFEALLPGREAVAVNSCTSGLMLALRVLGVQGQVLMPSFTFTATAHAAVWNGCTPVFVDCEPDTLNI